MHNLKVKKNSYLSKKPNPPPLLKNNGLSISMKTHSDILQDSATVISILKRKGLFIFWECLLIFLAIVKWTYHSTSSMVLMYCVFKRA